MENIIYQIKSNSQTTFKLRAMFFRFKRTNNQVKLKH